MQQVTVELWIGDQEDVVSYTVSVDDGVINTEAAIEKARIQAEQDGHDDINLKQIDPA